MRKMLKKLLISLLIISIFISSFSISSQSFEQYNSTDFDKLTHKQELTIPIDTSLELAMYQPIDMRVEFSDTCWAKDETLHSVRVGFDDGIDLTEIESQIYDLEYSDDTHITSCSLVFLIPERANGKEKYYVVYDSSEVEASDYEDHLSVVDTHYFFEPIPGQKISFDYYGIFEDNYILYAPIQKGEIMGNPVSHTIVKLKPKTVEFETNYIDQLASFDFRYGIFGEPDYTGSSAITKATKSVLVDGNLMIRLKIEGMSPEGDIKTDNIYTYYYCPTETKKIFVDVNHEILKTVDIEDPDVLDGAYVGLNTIKARSTTIEKLNVGNILPQLKLYDEDGAIQEFYIPPDPKSVEKELILSTEDDVDLGSKAWISLSDPATGKTHGLILQSNTGFADGNEDGLQIKSYVKQNIKLPGIEGDTGNVYLTKNAYEKGGKHDTILPQGFKVNFGVVFITDEDEGYERVDSESEILQTLIKNIPIFRENITDGAEEEEDRFSLAIYVHLAPSAPMGSLLSAFLGKNIPYINAELYKENSFKSGGAVGRLPIGAIALDFEGQKPLQIIRSIIGIFDWKGASFFKKIKFPDLDPGTYVVKIFRENLFLGREKQYIGYAIVELEKDETIHISCRPQGTIKLSILDQDKKAVENVKFLLERDEVAIADAITDKNGTVTLNAPCYPTKPYKLRVIYQGFLVDEKEVKFGLINRLVKLKESFSIKHYNLNLKVKDTWGFAPAVDVNPTLSSDEMVEPIYISAEKKTDGEYVFTNIYPADYSLYMKYKSFDLEEKFSIEKDNSLELSFPAEYEIDFDVMNSYGDFISNGKISVLRNSKKKITSIDENGKSKISIPPGKYQITVYSEEEKIAKQEIDVRGDKEITIVSNVESIYHNIIMFLGIILALFSIIWMFWKRKYYTGLKLFVIALLIIGLVSPWWVLNGDDGTTSTTAKTFLYPPKIITLSSSPNVIGGDISQVPSEITMVLSLLMIFIVLSCLTICITIFTITRFRKTTIFFSILSIILLIVTLFIFFYTMGQITEVGVGSFIGSGDLETSLPGIAESKILPSSWGPGIGFYLGMLSVILLVLVSLLGKTKKLKIKKEEERKVLGFLQPQ